MRFPLLLLMLVAMVFVPLVGHAQEAFNLIVCQGTSGDPCDLNDLLTLFQRFINALIVLVTMIAPLLLAYAGFIFITNGESLDGRKKAKDVLMNTVLGFAIMLGAWLVVSAILAGLSTKETFIFLQGVQPLNL